MGLEWWHWLVLGLVLVALELAASGGFYVIFFGIAVLDAIRGGNWQTIGFWLVVAIAFGWMGRRGGWRAPRTR